MADSVALNEVVRVLGTELGKNHERALIGSTEEEKAVLQKHSTSGMRRAVFGFIGGSAVCAGVWKALGGQRRLLGGLTVASGGMAGFMYGFLSIRRGLFEDILTIPSDKSPFAHRAREILDEQLPNNAFYLEVKQLMKQQSVDNGSWDTVPSFSTFEPFKADEADSRDSDRSVSVSTSSADRMRRLPPLPQQQDKPGTDYSENETSPSTSSSSSSPFFFAGSSGREPSTSSPAQSSSPYGDYDNRPPVAKKPQDDDSYYNDDSGWDNDTESQSKPKPVTWEELRRRAASGKQ